MKYIPLLLLLSSCCASPKWKGCGLDDVALSLPPMSQSTEYKLFKQLSDGNPDYYYVLINRNELLLNKGAKKLPFLVDGLDIWKIPYSTVIYLTAGFTPKLLAQTIGKKSDDFEILKQFIEFKRPRHTVALVHEDEQLFHGEWTPMHFDDMRIFVIPQARNLRLVKAARAAA